MDRLFLLEVSLFIFLLIVVIFIVLKLKVKKKFFFSKKGSIEEIERFFFTPKSYISILKIEQKILVLGITENSISKIQEIDDEGTYATFIKKNEETKKDLNFRDFFIFNKEKDKEVEKLKSRLKKMRQENEEN